MLADIHERQTPGRVVVEALVGFAEDSEAPIPKHLRPRSDRLHLRAGQGPDASRAGSALGAWRRRL